MHPLEHNQSLISLIWLEFCGGGRAGPGGQTNGPPVDDASECVVLAPAATTTLTTAESTASRYDLKLPVLAIFVIRVTQSESHVTPYCLVSYITFRPHETFGSVVLVVVLSVDVLVITTVQPAACCCCSCICPDATS